MVKKKVRSMKFNDLKNFNVLLTDKLIFLGVVNNVNNTRVTFTNGDSYKKFIFFFVRTESLRFIIIIIIIMTIEYLLGVMIC